MINSIESDQDLVLSECHILKSDCPSKLSCPDPLSIDSDGWDPERNLVFTDFSIHLEKNSRSSDNDLRVERRSLRNKSSSLRRIITEAEIIQQSPSSSETMSVRIWHNMATTLNAVGTQVWNGSLLMADWIIMNRDDLIGECLMEIGCGVGLIGVLVDHFCPLIKYYLGTDFHENILKIAEFNCQQNSRSTVTDQPHILFQKFNLLEMPNSNRPHSQSENHSCILQQRPTVILASDMIYSSELTEAFVLHLRHLLTPSTMDDPSPKLYLTLEKRLNFVCDSLGEEGAVCDVAGTHFWASMSESWFVDRHGPTKRWKFSYKTIDLDSIPKFISGYTRNQFMEMWCIWVVLD